jgi:hypothetical protein
MKRKASRVIVDVTVANQGSIFTFTLHTERARAWVRDNLEIESWQWLGANTFGVDHHFADSVAAMMGDPGEGEGPGLVVR